MADVVRVTQEAVEVLYAPPTLKRVSQVAVEVLYRVPVPSFVTQIAVEVLYFGIDDYIPQIYRVKRP